MDKIKTLSQAIRLGATFGAQCRGTMFSELNSSCALAAAGVALGADPKLHHTNQVSQLLHRRWPALFDQYGFSSNEIVHPVTGAKSSLSLTIVELNDKCAWTREQIADWLESIGF